MQESQAQEKLGKEETGRNREGVRRKPRKKRLKSPSGFKESLVAEIPVHLLQEEDRLKVVMLFLKESEKLLKGGELLLFRFGEAQSLKGKGECLTDFPFFSGFLCADQGSREPDWRCGGKLFKEAKEEPPFPGVSLKAFQKKEHQVVRERTAPLEALHNVLPNAEANG